MASDRTPTTSLTFRISVSRMTQASATYKDAGVDLTLYDESMDRVARLVSRTFSPRVVPHVRPTMVPRAC